MGDVLRGRFLAPAMLWGLSLCDLLLTLYLMGEGASETNPIMTAMFNVSPEFAAFFKVATMGTYCIVLSALWERRLARVATWTFIVVYILLVAYELLLVWGR